MAVFTLIVKGTRKYGLIEGNACYLHTESTMEIHEEALLINDCFLWGDAGDTALAPGLDYLYNHSCNPNCITQFNNKYSSMEFYALQDIQESIESTHNYCDDP